MSHKEAEKHFLAAPQAAKETDTDSDDEAEEQEPCFPRIGARGLSSAEMDYAFPWHLACDSNLRVTSLGSCLGPRFTSLVEGTNLLSLVRVVRPQLANGTFESLADICGKDTLLVVRDSFYHTSEAVQPILGGVSDGPASESSGRGDSGLDSSSPTPPLSEPAIAAEPGAPGASPLSGCGVATAAPPSPSRLRRKKSDRGAPSSPLLRRLNGPRSLEDSLDGDAPCNKKRRASVAMPVHIERQSASMLYLRGEFMLSSDGRGVVFLGAPSVHSVDALAPLGVCLDDFPVHCNGRELLQSAAHQLATVRMAEEITETRAELDQALGELRMEQRKQEMLLHSILPESVAAQLSQGVRPKARKHTNVSVLFSDIVGFTTISSSASPTEIMDMLDSLFSRFDVLCERHGVYKLETIGDAYLVLSGLPAACEDHADRLAAFAVDMLAASREVLSPLTGEPLEIRVGLHTGSVVAGVAGTTRPRYCVFGDTVNVASRMESTSEKGRIQMSGEFRRELVDASRFTFTSRGPIAVKGKGELATFFLESYTGLPACVSATVDHDSGAVEDDAHGLACDSTRAAAPRATFNPPSHLTAAHLLAAETAPLPVVAVDNFSVRSQGRSSQRSSVHKLVFAIDDRSDSYSPIAPANDCAATIRSAPSEFGDERHVVLRTSTGPRSCSPRTVKSVEVCGSPRAECGVPDMTAAPMTSYTPEQFSSAAAATLRSSSRGMLRRAASLHGRDTREASSSASSSISASRADGPLMQEQLELPTAALIRAAGLRLRAQSDPQGAGAAGRVSAALPSAEAAPPPAAILDFEVAVYSAADAAAAGGEGGEPQAAVTLAFVPGRMLLSDVLSELEDAAGAEVGSARPGVRLYTDTVCRAALPKGLSLGELHAALVGRQQRASGDRSFVLYWK